MGKGKTIKLFLVDGEPGGLLVAEVINWTIRALVVPRSELGRLAKRDEADGTGVCMLIGRDPEGGLRPVVYVGESENVYTRLLQHNKSGEKDFWTTTVLIVSKDDNLTKAHVKYLEARLIAVVRDFAAARSANGNQPEEVKLPESDIADMDGFLEQIRILLPVLGFDFLERPVAEPVSRPVGESSPPPVDSPDGVPFVLEYAGFHADAIERAGEFVVLKGSTARRDGTTSWVGNRALRDELVVAGILGTGPHPATYVFTQNYAFSSPSQAGNIVTASQINGRRAWRHRDSEQSYAEWHEERLAPSSPVSSEGEGSFEVS